MFQRLATSVSRAAGSSFVFCTALLLVVVWVIGGFIFGFTDLYQLIINTLTTIITFLMVFLIQNTQNRDMAALHVKLDALITELKEVNSKYAHIQEKSLEDIEQIDREIKSSEKDNDEIGSSR